MRNLSVKEQGDKAYLVEHNASGDKIDMTIPLPSSGTTPEDVSKLQEDINKIQSKLEEQESANNDGRINTDKEVHDFLEGYGENEKLADKIGDNMTDEDILDTFGYKPGDIDFDNE